VGASLKSSLTHLQQHCGEPSRPCWPHDLCEIILTLSITIVEHRTRGSDSAEKERGSGRDHRGWVSSWVTKGSGLASSHGQQNNFVQGQASVAVRESSLLLSLQGEPCEVAWSQGEGKKPAAPGKDVSCCPNSYPQASHPGPTPALPRTTTLP
jgi:hypothetical protein